MREQLWEAATIAVVGVAVVMATLTILMLAIMLMTRLAPGKKGSTETEMAKTTEEDGASKESVAAIAVAVALAMEEHEPKSIGGHGKSPVSQPTGSRWSAAGKERLMGSRGKAGRKWGGTSR
jgi:sodium pump decarboxylase gamma subunit